ncbi:TRAP transporter small permease subunit [Neomegalonema sp.]|uniref:TRAP transporter small permease subunit n=1 Tax=Neomegalonema sp. TaxID=2039713 RepID=UPI00260310E7|nr:TRAP transporter small permease subunit [Neomegalonema sp.]MDD2868922.1 TRAP transporter small permease subunit [Neomegalonema sp.]
MFLSLSRAIDSVNGWIGRKAAWLLLAATAISAGNAIIRKTLNTSSNVWLDAQWMLFSAVFLLCASWTLRDNEHVRIDVLSNRFSKRTRDWIDVIGHAFVLIPFCLIMIWTSVPFARASIATNEQSFAAGGLPQWPIKLLMPVAFTLLLLQAISELIKRLAILNGRMEDPVLAADAAEAEVERLKAAIIVDEADEASPARP